jgi:ligand-binding SRPBCC domain-containing protein
MHFRVVTPAPIRIEPGTVIDYQLRIHGIPLRWRSKIAVWEPPQRFVDEQVRGPYRRWHHEHLFDETPGGTRIRDIVHYAVPGGRLVHALFVKPDLLKIFAYRTKRLRELFGRP